MRYFALDDRGAIRYLENAEIEADTKSAKAATGLPAGRAGS